MKFVRSCSLSLSVVAPLATALSTSEANDFKLTTDCYVTEGVCNGEYLRASVSVTSDARSYTIKSNGIPNYATCPESTASGGTCYTDPLTTWIEEQDLSYRVPKTPTEASSAGCLPAGGVGMAKNGVLLFSAYSRPCTDAFEDESIGFDACMGHPQENGQYHHHTAPVCLPGWAENFASKNEYFVGVAWDGFPIYGPYDASGKWVSNSQLDECHGYNPGSGYRYIANDEFPYIIGCYKGTTPYVSIQCHCSSSSSSSLENAPKRINLTEATQRRLQRPPPPGRGQDCDASGRPESKTMCSTNGFSGDGVSDKACWGKSSKCISSFDALV